MWKLKIFTSLKQVLWVKLLYLNISRSKLCSTSCTTKRQTIVIIIKKLEVDHKNWIHERMTKYTLFKGTKTRSFGDVTQLYLRVCARS